MTIATSRRFFVATSFWLAGALALAAQLPVARLANLFPPGGQAGSQFEVSMAGSDLDEPAGLHFTHAGITATPVGSKFTIAIRSNVPPGVYEARFVGRFGLSNPRAFVVGILPESVTPATNTSAASAIELTPNMTINSRIQPNAAAWFRFSAKKGQRFFAECLADSIDSRMDSTLVLSDSSGRELERSRTTGLIDFTAPAEGEYRLRVADFLYRGGDDYVYRLTLSTGPRLDFVLPPSGVPGAKANFTLYGRNLPGGQLVKGQTIDGKPLEQLSVSIAVPGEVHATRLDTGLPVAPGAASLDGFDYRLEALNGTSNPFLIGFAAAPVTTEQEPNDRQAQKISPPCEIAGQFFTANDADLFAFDAKKGDVFWVEVFSQRLGLPTDPMFVIQRVTKNDKGEEQVSDITEAYDQDTNIGDREFNTTSRDPVTRFEAKEDGAYRIVVRDLFGRTQASPRHVYRLAVRREAPDFRLVAMAVAPKYKADAKDIPIGVPMLRRGETIAVRVMAFRRDGFGGDIELSLDNPPPGLRFDGDRIESGKSTDYILLTAAVDAPAFAGPVHLVGRAKIADKEIAREARGGTMRFVVASTDSERPESRATGEFTLAISDKESAPITVEAKENKALEVSANGKLEIPLRITRRGEFNAALKLKPLGPGAQESLKEFDVEAKATNATLKLDFAALKLTPGRHIFSAQATTTGKYRNNPEAAAAAEAAAEDTKKLSKTAADEAKKAAEEFDKAVKAASDAEAAAKSAAEKLASAQAAAEKAPDDEKTKAALDVAQKESDEAVAKAKPAVEAKESAEKSKSSAESKSKDAQSRKEEAAKRAKELNEKAKPRDVSYQVTAAPIIVNVKPAPVADAKKESQQAKSK